MHAPSVGEGLQARPVLEIARERTRQWQLAYTYFSPSAERFAAGQYTWIPLEHIASVRMVPPKRLRDLLWAPAVVRTGPDFQGIELGEVLVPVMAPLSWHHENDAVRLGRVTEWQELDDGSQTPVGQKLLAHAIDSRQRQWMLKSLAYEPFANRLANT